MKELLDLGNRYADESTWKDFALVKFCLFSMGLAAGMKLPEKYREKALKSAGCVFLLTYVPLMGKLAYIAHKKAKE